VWGCFCFVSSGWIETDYAFRGFSLLAPRQLLSEKLRTKTACRIRFLKGHPAGFIVGNFQSNSGSLLFNTFSLNFLYYLKIFHWSTDILLF
jgi:hypothetical protein